MARAAALLCALACVSACSAQSLAVVDDGVLQTEDVAPVPLTDVLPSATVGREVFGERDAGNCVLCHRIAGLDVPFQGDVGPDLTAVGLRLSPPQLRYRIVDASRLNPATVMPAYYRTERLNRVAEDYRGRTVLTGEQVEHLVAYLSSLRGASLRGDSLMGTPP